MNIGATDARQTSGYTFTLFCPDNERDFIFSAETREEMEQWICSLQKIIDTPLTPQDAKCKLTFPLQTLTYDYFV